MFLTMLLITFLVAAFIAWVVVTIFNKPVTRILGRLIPEEISLGWLKYVNSPSTLSVYPVGYVSDPWKSTSAPVKIMLHHWCSLRNGGYWNFTGPLLGLYKVYPGCYWSFLYSRLLPT